MAKWFLAWLLRPNSFFVKLNKKFTHTVSITHCYYDGREEQATVHFLLPSNTSGTLSEVFSRS